MINLPRNLVYTDRTALSDFMEENELNREIGFVLEGMLRFQCGSMSLLVCTTLTIQFK